MTGCVSLTASQKSAARKAGTSRTTPAQDTTPPTACYTRRYMFLSAHMGTDQH